ncbi:MAG: phosphoribosylformylglycinamidine synthase [Actinomycetaceae bacterium]|nr:phosphoribosylformylglycinamidine synthase [Actinomycetaceae bacterium]
MQYRLSIRRQPQFREAEVALKDTLNLLEGVELADVAILHVYDVFESNDAERAALLDAVVNDERVDEVIDDAAFAAVLADDTVAVLGVEQLPGQYDQRADAAEQALGLLQPDSVARIYSSQVYVLAPPPTPAAFETIQNYLINPVETRVKKLDQLREPSMGDIEALAVYSDFLELDDAGLDAFLRKQGLAMSFDDLRLVQEYFQGVGRVPTEVEISVLDTYWSDHCRHTTFNTELVEIKNSSTRFGNELDRIMERWNELRAANGRGEKTPTLMDAGTIIGKELRRTGRLDSQEVSEEINACSVYVTAKTQEGDKPWLLMFKNETHNHPTEIEPFGGASTCLGGAIRDPLSGRSWVYQALRITGAGDINTPRGETLEGKLPQADISTRATAGYSSYGNQIGVAATQVRELVHPGYVAKRMELGAVVAAAPLENVVRSEPQPGDVVVLVGGRTGRDGIGGATGSSKAHDEESLERSGAEVQKGNPVEERKILRLFRNPEVAKSIVRCNDFGAGGVSVAVGELADGLDIHLERVPLKYAGLNAKEIAISESQERMAVVISPDDEAAFMDACLAENLEATVIATVTDTGRLRMFLGEETVLDIERSFLDTNGARRTQTVDMRDFAAPLTPQAPASILESLAGVNAGSQEGMIEQFDSTVGRSTVLMPYGGVRQKTAESVSAQTLPVDGGTSTASLMTYGYSTELADDSPYLMGAYSVVDALAKMVAAGADLNESWLTVQEYFRRLDNDPQAWGEVMQALLGLIEAQDEFGVAAIGGKDSMSGSFGEDLNVPPTLVTFAVSTADTADVISSTLPYGQWDLYYLPHTPEESGRPNYAQLRTNFAALTELAASGSVVAASAVRGGGLGETIVNMCLGNDVGFFASSTTTRMNIAPGEEVATYINAPLGGIVFAVDPQVNVARTFAVGAAREANPDRAGVLYLGATTDKNSTIDFGFESFTVDEALATMERGYSAVYPLNIAEGEQLPDFARVESDPSAGLADAATDADADAATPADDADAPPVRVLLPVFPGSNSEYDMAEAFQAAGADTEFLVIRNLTAQLLEADTQSFIDRLNDVDILAFSGGFSMGDEPDGSAKFMAAFLRADNVASAVKDFVARDGLILGVCNGFQALIKSGFLPYGDPDKLAANSPTLVANRQLRHISRIVATRVTPGVVASPWLDGFTTGEIHRVPVSHGEGRFVASEEEARALFDNGQVAFQYVDGSGQPTMNAPDNPNGSQYAIEGIVSADGRILGKMGHPERYRAGLMKNIPDVDAQNLFTNAVSYCRKK